MSNMFTANVMSKWNGKYIAHLTKNELLDYCHYLERQNIKMSALINRTRTELKDCMRANDACSTQIQKTFTKFKEIEEEYERAEQNTKVVKQTGA